MKHNEAQKLPHRFASGQIAKVKEISQSSWLASCTGQQLPTKRPMNRAADILKSSLHSYYTSFLFVFSS